MLSLLHRTSRTEGRLTVSSLQMEWSCVPNITAVKVRKRMASRQRKISSSTDTPGEKSLHSGHGKRGRKVFLGVILKR